MTGMWKDLTYGFRVLAKSPGFALTAILSLALGIGANTAIFSVVNGVLLRPFPVEEPGRLARLDTLKVGLNGARSSYPDFEDIRELDDVFDGAFARSYWPVSIGSGEGPRVVLGNLVCADYFKVLGVQTAAGRAFLREETTVPGAEPVAVVSHALWADLFGADPNLVGATVRINNYPFTVVGVASEGFRGVMAGFATDVWLPITMSGPVLPGRVDLEDRGSGWMDMMVRLGEDVSPARAQAALDVLAARLAREHPETNRDKGFGVITGAAARFPITGMGTVVSLFLVVVMGVVCLLLLIACSNVANLLLARGVARQREMALRLSLGAGRGRVVRQLLTESISLGVIAGLVGLLVATWLVEMFMLVEVPSPLPVELDLAIDYRVLCFTLGASLVTGVLFGLMPALRASGLNLFSTLRSQRANSGGRRGEARAQKVLVVTQVALSLVLLVAAGLFTKSLREALVMDPGFDARNGIVAGLNLSYGQYSEEDGRNFIGRLVERLEELPAVESASLGVLAPLSYSKQTSRIVVEGYEAPNGEDSYSEFNSVTAGYFETLGIPLERGRGIEERDGRDSQSIAVINETMARRFWGEQDPIGRAFTMYDSRITVVGIARDGKYMHLGEEPTPFFWRPLLQVYAPFLTVHVRTREMPARVIPSVITVIEDLDPSLPMPDIHTIEEHLRLTQYPAIMGGIMVGGFGALALLLAMVGVYGVLSYLVSQRTHEFGIRAAMGAERGQILRTVLFRGLKLTLAGVAIGLAGSLAVAQVLASLLIGVSPYDPMVYIGVAGLVVLVAAGACYFPARWAMKVEPSVALRHE